MSEKFHGKYRIKSARHPYWDYGSNVAYFVTICSHHHQHFFGKILNNKMNLSDIGKIAEKYWLDIQMHCPYVKLDEFVVMPNHIHGIIIIDKPNTTDNSTTVSSVMIYHFIKYENILKTIPEILEMTNCRFQKIRGITFSK